MRSLFRKLAKLAKRRRQRGGNRDASEVCAQIHELHYDLIKTKALLCVVHANVATSASFSFLELAENARKIVDKLTNPSSLAASRPIQT